MRKYVLMANEHGEVVAIESNKNSIIKAAKKEGHYHICGRCKIDGFTITGVNVKGEM